MIRNCAASLSLSRGTAAGPSSAQLLMKQENLACGPQCPQFEEQLCPGAVFLPPDFPRYRAVSQQTREIFKRHTDLIESRCFRKQDETANGYTSGPHDS
jgi:hypothetical protein